METEVSILCAADLTTGAYLDPPRSSPRPQTLLLKDSFCNIILASTARYSKWCLFCSHSSPPPMCAGWPTKFLLLIILLLRLLLLHVMNYVLWGPLLVLGEFLISLLMLINFYVTLFPSSTLSIKLLATCRSIITLISTARSGQEMLEKAVCRWTISGACQLMFCQKPTELEGK